MNKMLFTDAIKEGYSTESKLEISKQSDINDVCSLFHSAMSLKF